MCPKLYTASGLKLSCMMEESGRLSDTYNHSYRSVMELLMAYTRLPLF